MSIKESFILIGGLIGLVAFLAMVNQYFGLQP